MYISDMTVCALVLATSASKVAAESLILTAFVDE